jgi:hypothetical protein
MRSSRLQKTKPQDDAGGLDEILTRKSIAQDDAGGLDGILRPSKSEFSG